MSMPNDEVPFNLDVEMKRWMRDELDVIDRVLNGGNAKDFAHYKQLCGERAGLLKAHNRLLELIENWNDRG